MNNLSWFLYIADVLPVFSSFVFWTCLVCTLFLGISWAVISMIALEQGTEAEKDYANKFGKFYTWRFLPVALLLVGVSLLIPSKETIYLIAGSEAGEYVASTPQAQEILNDVHEIIKQQLETMKND